MNEFSYVIEEVTDPEEVARFREQDRQHKRNRDWLQAHWGDVLPQARGKFLAVASEEGHIADTPEQAWAWTETVHPEDRGAFVQYVFPEGGFRFYANRWRVASL